MRLALLIPLALLPNLAGAACEDWFIPPDHEDDLQDIVVDGYALLGTTVRGTMIDVRLGLRARSRDGAAFGDVTARLTPPPAGTVIDGEVSFSHIPATGTVVSDDGFTIRIPRRALVPFRNWLFGAGFGWDFAGWELPTFKDHVLLVDGETDAAWLSTTPDPILGDVWWFAYETPLLAGANAGSVLIPTPDIEHWTGVTPVWPTAMPTDDGSCADTWPLEVRDVILGDGTNGGPAGALGLRVAPIPADWASLYRSARMHATWSSAPDSGRDGPFDSVSSAGDELGTEGRSCPFGAEEHDTDGDGTIDACGFTREMARFNIEPVEGVQVAGNVVWRSFDMDFELVSRDETAVSAVLSLEAVVDSAFGVRAEGQIDVPRQEVDFASVSIPVFSFPLGPTWIDVLVDWRAFGGYDGLIQAQTGYGVVRTDVWTHEVTWTPGAGTAGVSAHEVSTWPMTGPEIRTAASAEFVAFAGTEIGVSISEGTTFSGLETTLIGEVGLGLDVDTTRVPWWQLEGEASITATAGFELLGGLAGTWGRSWELASATEVLLQDEGDGDVGAEGDEARWLRTWDPNTAVTTDATASDAAALPDGDLLVSGRAGVDGYVSRINPDGSVQWARKLGFTSGAASIVALSDGSAVVSTSSCATLVRLDPDGNLLWRKRLNPSGASVSGSCELLAIDGSDGVEGVVFMGQANASGGLRPAWGRIDADGTLRWWSRLDLTGNLTSGTLLSDGRLALVGEIGAPAYAMGVADGYTPSIGGALVLVGDDTGGVDWARSMTGNTYTDVVQSAAGDILAVGNMTTYIYHPRHGMMLSALATDGTLLWSTTYAEDVEYEGREDSANVNTPGDTAWDGGGAIAALPGGGVVLAGHTGLGASRGMWVARLTDDGEPVWFWLHDAGGEDAANTLVTLSDSVLFGGKTAAYGDELGWLARLPLDGAIWHASAHTERSMQAEINDATDMSHVLWVDQGGAAVAATVVPVTATVTDATTAVSTVTAETVERAW
jgi:hypothetical protein